MQGVKINEIVVETRQRAFLAEKTEEGKTDSYFFSPIHIKAGCKKVCAHLPSVRCFTAAFENTDKCGRIVMCC